MHGRPRARPARSASAPQTARKGLNGYVNFLSLTPLTRLSLGTPPDLPRTRALNTHAMSILGPECPTTVEIRYSIRPIGAAFSHSMLASYRTHIPHNEYNYNNIIITKTSVEYITRITRRRILLLLLLLWLYSAGVQQG